MKLALLLCLALLGSLDVVQAITKAECKAKCDEEHPITEGGSFQGGPAQSNLDCLVGWPNCVPSTS